MPLYSIEGPDGKTYKIEGPENATREQVIQAIQARQTLEKDSSEEVSGQDSSVDQRDPNDRGIPNTTESEGVFTEIQEGVMGGLLGIGQGIGELALLPIDYIYDTNLSSKVTDAAEAVRDYAGIDPVGIVGKGTEVVTQFVAPPAKVASLVNKASKAKRAAKGLKDVPLTKGEKFGLAAKEIAAAAAVDVMVSSNGTTTIGDFFEGGPTQTDKTIGLEGRAEALRQIGNRLKFGAEAGGAGALAETVLRGTGLIGKEVAQSQAGQKAITALKGLEARRLGDPFAKLEDLNELNFTQKIFADLFASTRFRSYLPDRIATERLFASEKVKPQIKRAESIIKNLEKNIDSSLTKLPKNQTSLRRAEIMNDINESLIADTALKPRLLQKLPKEIRSDVIRMRNQIDDLSTQIKGSNFLKDNDFINKNTNKSIKDTIQDNIGTYLRRRYRIFEDAKYVPDAQTLKIADDYFKQNKNFTELQLNKIYQKSPQNLSNDVMSRIGATVNNGKLSLGASVPDEAARLAREDYLQSHRIKNRGPKLSSGRVATEKLNAKMFLERESVPKQLRVLLGEIDDPRESYLGTVSDLAQFSAVDDFFGTVKTLADGDEGFGKLFINPNKLKEQQLKDMLDSGQYVQLGSGNGRSTLVGEGAAEGIEETLNTSGWGSLYGYVVPERIYKDLTNQILNPDHILAKIGLMSWGAGLRAKGLSQYSKTILSPVTQIRNVTTAAAFAMAQGNIGKGANLFDSLRLVRDDILSKSSDEVLEELAEMQRRGVLGSQAEVREIQDMLRQGAGFKQNTSASGFESLLGKKASDIKGLKTISKGINLAEKTYTGGDDIWKIYNYKFEISKLNNAMASASPTQKFSYLTKDLADFEKTQLRNSMEKMTPAEVAKKYQELIKDRAASTVRENVPNYNKSPDIIKGARKLPVGNFITFPYEIYRTGFNTIKQGLDEVASEIPSIRNIGKRRLLGAVSTYSMLPASVAAAGYYYSGVSRDEMKAYQRSFAASWEKNSLLIPYGRDKKGFPKYINFSFSNPYDTLLRGGYAAINAIETGDKLNKPVDKIMGDIITQAIKETAEPFLSQSMIVEAAIDVIPVLRSGRRTTGAEIYNPQDPAGVKVGKGIAHVLQSVLPNVIPITGGAKPEPSRFIRGFVGNLAPDIVSSKSNSGLERQISDELVRAFAGVTPLTIDAPKILKYRAYELRRGQTNSKRMFNRAFKNINATPQTFINAYREANEAKFKNDTIFYQTVQDAKTLGLKDAEIFKIFKDNGIGGIDGIMVGRFEPFTISKNNEKEMIRSNTVSVFPSKEIFELQRSYLNRSFELPEEEPQEESSLTVPQEQVVKPPQVQVAETPVVESNIQSSATQNINTSGAVNTANVSPELLGDDPFSQAANAQIARRLNT